MQQLQCETSTDEVTLVCARSSCLLLQYSMMCSDGGTSDSKLTIDPWTEGAQTARMTAEWTQTAGSS